VVRSDKRVLEGLRPGVSAKEAAMRSRRISLVLTDCDGVLTDNGVYYSDRGEVMKRFSIRDGMGVERLRAAGIETGIMSGEVSPSILKRAEKLRLQHVYLGIADKRELLFTVLARHGWVVDNVAFMGDDVNDLPVITELQASGLTAAPVDALPCVRQAVHYVSAASGGCGAFRDFAEWILSHRLRDITLSAEHAVPPLVRHTTME